MKQAQRDYYRRMSKIKHLTKSLRDIAVELQTYKYEEISDIGNYLLKLNAEEYMDSKK